MPTAAMSHCLLLLVLACAAVGLATWVASLFQRCTGRSRIGATIDLIDSPAEGRGMVPKAVKKFGAIARSRVGYLSDSPANRLVADKVVRQVLEEANVRYADRHRIAPFVAASLFVPLRSEVEAQDLLRTRFVADRRARYNGTKRPEKRGQDPHRPSQAWEEEEEEETGGTPSGSRDNGEPKGALATEVSTAPPVGGEGTGIK